MGLNDIRLELSRQHQAIRERIANTLATAERVLGGQNVRELIESLHQLRVQLEAHNAHEEKVLRGLMRSVDAWGEIRERLMDEHHEVEHESLLAGLETCAALRDGPEAVRCARQILARIREHLDHEDRELLSPDVLRDDIISVQPFAG